jgi:hypothetical protein
MPLFADWERTDPEPMRHVETVIGFLDRVHRPYYARARNLVNDWVDRYPAPHRERLITRLRSESGEQQLAAFWELYIHEVMRAAGWEMTVDPPVLGTKHVPDFLAARGEHAVYIEATSSNRSSEQVADDNRLARVMDELAKLEPSDFSLWVDCDRSGPDSPRAAGLRDELARWLSRLSRDDALRDYESGGFDALPKYEWRRDGWEFSFAAYPHGDVTGAPDLPVIAAEGRTAGYIVDHTTPMQRAFKAKHKRYGNALEHPFVLAYLNTNESPANAQTHLHALFGPLTGGPDGCWYAKGQPVSRDIAAVIAVWNLMPTRVLSAIPTVFLNPWASRPLTTPMPWPTVEFDPAKRRSTETKPTVSLAQLLSVPEEFDGRARPFEDE